MEIAMTNGSPKKNSGVSISIMEQLEKNIDSQILKYQAINFIKESNTNYGAIINKILNADVIVFVFPLYVDMLPMPLINFLNLIELHSLSTLKKPRVYAVCHSGFYEAAQNETAIDIIENFCNRVGFIWKYGIGIGAGTFLGKSGNISNGPTKEIYNVLKALSINIKSNDESKKENIFISPTIPRSMYELGGNIEWFVKAKANKVVFRLFSTPFLK